MDTAPEFSGAKMKAGDFRPCAICGKGVMHTGLPLFYRVTIQRMGIDRSEVQRSHGMEQFFGGALALSRVFHDPDIAKPITEQYKVLVCEECSMKPHLLAALIETARNQAEKPEADKAA